MNVHGSVYAGLQLVMALYALHSIRDVFIPKHARESITAAIALLVSAVLIVFGLTVLAGGWPIETSTVRSLWETLFVVSNTIVCVCLWLMSRRLNAGPG